MKRTPAGIAENSKRGPLDSSAGSGGGVAQEDSVIVDKAVRIPLYGARRRATPDRC
jgi:hypothetical protein